MGKRQHLRGSRSSPGRTPTTVAGMRAAALAKPGGPGGIANMVRVVEHGWCFLLSHDETCGIWVFSAQLDQIRNTTIDDWRELGAATAAVGVPAGVEPLGARTPERRSEQERLNAASERRRGGCF